MIWRNLLAKFKNILYMGFRATLNFRKLDRHYGLIVSPRMNTIAFRNQFKPIRIGDNLVVNYKLS